MKMNRILPGIALPVLFAISLGSCSLGEQYALDVLTAGSARIGEAEGSEESAVRALFPEDGDRTGEAPRRECLDGERELIAISASMRLVVQQETSLPVFLDAKGRESFMRTRAGSEPACLRLFPTETAAILISVEPGFSHLGTESAGRSAPHPFRLVEKTVYVAFLPARTGEYVPGLDIAVPTLEVGAVAPDLMQQRR